MDLYIDTAKICFTAGISFGMGLYVAYRIADLVETLIDKIRNPKADKE